MTRSIFIVLTLLMFREASSQDKLLVSYEIADIGEVKPGDTINIRITLNVLPGWFIYAPTAGNKLQGAQVMGLRFNSIPNVLRMLGEVKMPEPRLNKSYDVFMDAGNVFYQRFIVNETATGTYNLTADLKYQACSSSICYPPIAEKIDIPIVVGKPVLPAKQVIQNAVQLAKKENKKAFIMFHSSWCVWCRKMDTAIQKK